MAQKKIPAWLPDWRDSRQYPPAKNHIPMERWAWEFLRRNPDYQADYKRQAAITGDSEAILEIRSKYNAGKMPDPALEFSDNVRRVLHFKSFQGPAYLPYRRGQQSHGLNVTQPGEVAVLFNVSRPIKIEIK